MAAFAAVILGTDVLHLRANVPPNVEHVTFERVRITGQGLEIRVRANGPKSMTIAQVIVDNAFWTFTQDPSGPLARGQTAVLRIDYPWVRNETHHLRLLSATGATFDLAIETARETPVPSFAQAMYYAGLGLCVGLVPIAAGMLSFPAMKRIGGRGMDFILALTVGLLAYLFLDMVIEGLDLAARASPIFGGATLVIMPMLLTFAAMLAYGNHRSAAGRGDGVTVAVLIALGIGLHNFGEGLAIGASFAANKAAIGAFLIVGFALHNLTEGIGVVSPLLNERPKIAALAGLALLAGLPLVPGIWLGAFSMSPHYAALFFGIGAGAVAQVIVEIERFSRRRHADERRPRFNLLSVAGYFAGVGIMAVTALLITI